MFVRNTDIIQRKPALLNQATRLPLRGEYAAARERIHEFFTDLHVNLRELCRRTAAKKSLCRLLRLPRLLFAMNNLGRLIGKDFFGAVDLLSLGRCKTAHFLHRKIGEQGETDLYIGIINIAPVLIEVIGRGLFCIEPKRTACRLAHLRTVALREQLVRESEYRDIFLAAAELHPSDDIRPLIVPAHLEFAVIAFVELEEVIRLHDHIVELEEGQPLLPALLITLCSEHAIDSEMRTDISQEFDIVELAQPVPVIHHDCPIIREIDETRDLLAEAVAIMTDGLICHHLAHVRAPRGITNGSGAASHETDRTVSRTLHVGHCHERDQMACMEAVCRRIKSRIKGNLFLTEQLAQPFLIGALCKKSAFLQYVNGVQYTTSFLGKH